MPRCASGQLPSVDLGLIKDWRNHSQLSLFLKSKHQRQDEIINHYLRRIFFCETCQQPTQMLERISRWWYHEITERSSEARVCSCTWECCSLLLEAGSGYPTLKENAWKWGNVAWLVGRGWIISAWEFNASVTRKFECGHLLLSSCWQGLRLFSFMKFHVSSNSIQHINR